MVLTKCLYRLFTYLSFGGRMKTGYKVADAMTINPVIIASTTSLVECAKIMEKKHVGAILIGTKEKIDGIITEQDIVRKVIGHSINPLKKKVGENMEKKVINILESFIVGTSKIKAEKIGYITSKHKNINLTAWDSSKHIYKV